VRALLIVAALALVAWPAEARPDRRVVIAAVGDVLLDRGVRDAISRRGVDALFSGAAPEIARADLAVCNLECPLSRRGLRAAKPFSFRGDPEHAAALARAGFDAASLANNHTLDFGRTALLDTAAALEAAGVAAVGAGATREEAMRPRFVERNGLRIALLGYCQLFIEGTTPRADAPGVSAGDEEAFVASVRAAAARADAVVVLVHWGAEYRARPTAAQRDLARRLVDAGATFVAGAHPHVLQPVERSGGAVVAYSLGNFVFDQRREEASDTAVLLVTIGAAGVEAVDAVPMRIDDCRPAPATGEAAARIRRRLGV
jgi:poly-gamma-glutamate capsule biosynthesis protein CapA/YwtB (metallophosphatase superfamily)